MNLKDRALHRLLIRAALSGAHLFAWVFIFQYFYIQSRSVSGAFVSVLLTYALTHVIVILLTPVTASRLRHGYRRSLVASICALAASFLVLGAAFSGVLGDVALGIALFAILSGLYRALYWIPYEVAKETSAVRYREWIEVVIALIPLIGGLYITNGGQSLVYLMYIASALSLASIVPLLSMKDTYQGFSWSYRATFHELFEERHRSLLWSSVLSGLEAAALFILWPITVFTLLDWSYPLLGVVMSLTLLFTLVARKLFGDAVHAVPVRVQPLVAASGWVMRLGVGGFVGAVLVDTYFHTASRTAARGIDIHAYEQTGDNHTFVDEYTALKEMGMALGRIILCLVAAAFLGVFALPHALAFSFALAALAAGFSVYHATRTRAAY